MITPGAEGRGRLVCNRVHPTCSSEIRNSRFQNRVFKCEPGGGRCRWTEPKSSPIASLLSRTLDLPPPFSPNSGGSNRSPTRARLEPRVPALGDGTLLLRGKIGCSARFLLRSRGSPDDKVTDLPYGLIKLKTVSSPESPTTTGGVGSLPFHAPRHESAQVRDAADALTTLSTPGLGGKHEPLADQRARGDHHGLDRRGVGEAGSATGRRAVLPLRDLVRPPRGLRFLSGIFEPSGPETLIPARRNGCAPRSCP
jgi:hypothetical protein